MRRCGECGSTEVKLSDILGTQVPYKDYPSVLISKSHDFHRCMKCGNFVFKSGEPKILDGIITESITEQVQLFISLITDREGCEQQELAKHLGVTPEYLSSIKNGRIPGFQTFNFLKTLAFSGHTTFETSRPSFNFLKKTAG